MNSYRSPQKAYSVLSKTNFTKFHKVYLYILGKLIVAEYVHSGEFPDVVKLELDLERMTGPGVVSPSDPSLTSIEIVITHLEVIRPDLAVRQLSQAT